MLAVIFDVAGLEGGQDGVGKFNEPLPALPHLEAEGIEFDPAQAATKAQNCASV